MSTSASTDDSSPMQKLLERRDEVKNQLEDLKSEYGDLVKDERFLHLLVDGEEFADLVARKLEPSYEMFDGEDADRVNFEPVRKKLRVCYESINTPNESAGGLSKQPGLGITYETNNVNEAIAFRRRSYE